MLYLHENFVCNYDTTQTVRVNNVEEFRVEKQATFLGTEDAYEQFTARQIEAMYGIPRNTVSNRAKIFRRKIKNFF